MTPDSNVSVVIPTRNRGELLVHAVESALASPALEVIVADGGSDDGSIERIQSLDGRIVVVRGRYANAGATRNAGAALARGDYIGFLDSDDVMLPEKIPSLAAVLGRDDKIGLVHGHMRVIDSAGNEDRAATDRHRAAFEAAERIGTTYEALASVCTMFTSATLIRRRAFEDVGGYDEALEVYEDWDLYLRLALHWRLTYEHCDVARYRIWPGNVRWDRTAAGVVRVAEKHLAALPGELSPGARRDVQYAFLRRITESRHILLDGAATRRSALRAIRLQPLRALSDPGIRGPALRSLLPRELLRRRRPPNADN
jgi:glycosyltransferase involved in cell wall biosynthesis